MDIIAELELLLLQLKRLRKSSKPVNKELVKRLKTLLDKL